MSCFLSWFTRGVLRGDTITPASSPLVMASGTALMISMLVRSVRLYIFQIQSICYFFVLVHKYCLYVSVAQITQDDIRKTHGGSSGSRGYYSSAFARSDGFFVLPCTYMTSYFKKKIYNIILIFSFCSSTNAYMLIYRLKDPTRNASM